MDTLADPDVAHRGNGGGPASANGNGSTTAKGGGSGSVSGGSGSVSGGSGSVNDAAGTSRNGNGNGAGGRASLNGSPVATRIEGGQVNGSANGNGQGPSVGATNGTGSATTGIGGRVLVLNASYEPINVCNVRRAAVLVLKDRAEMLERGEGALHAERIELQRPCVIRLLRYVRIPRDVHRRKITRKAVLARDGWTCQYCGHEASGLTVDHVIPRSKGGPSDWDNIVASCAPCNRKKGSLTPHEARMHPRTTPKAPGPTVFIRIASPRVPLAWEQYLTAA